MLTETMTIISHFIHINLQTIRDWAPQAVLGEITWLWLFLRHTYSDWTILECLHDFICSIVKPNEIQK